MARRQAKEPTHPSGNNVSAMKDKLADIRKRERALEEQIDGLKLQRKNVRNEVKDLDIKLRDYDAAKRLADLEDEDRVAAKNNFILAYESLRPGEQMAMDL